MSVTSRLSRREMLFAGGLALGGSALGLGPSQVPVSSGSSSLRAGGRFVRVIEGSDPAFDPQVHELFPGLGGRAFQLIKPSAFLIQNASGPVIKAFSVIWSIATPSGTHSFSSFQYRRAHPVKQLLTGQSQFLPPGKTRLVSPFFNWTSAQLKRRGSSNLEGRLDVTPIHSFLAREMRSATAVQIQLDAVVYSDWTVIGPDANGLAEHFAIRRNAERDEAISLLSVLKSNPNPVRSDIIPLLRQHRSLKGVAGAEVPRSDAQFLYYQSRKLQAGTLLRRLKQSDTSTFLQDLQTISKKPAINIEPLVASAQSLR